MCLLVSYGVVCSHDPCVIGAVHFCMISYRTPVGMHVRRICAAVARRPEESF